MREKRRLRVFEIRVLRRIFGPTRKEVTGDWRKLHKGELNDLYSSPKIIRAMKSRIRWVGHGIRMGVRRGVYSVLIRKPEGKRKLGRSRLRWEDNITMNLREMRWGAWTRLI